MGMFTSGAKLYLSSRNRKVDNFRKNPIDLQKKVLKKLLLFSKKTSYGIRYSFNNLINYKDFSESVPVVNYEGLNPEEKKEFDEYQREQAEESADAESDRRTQMAEMGYGW